MAEVVEVTGTEMGTLEGDEMQTAKANLNFALENCPVDGGILLEDGCTSSRESLEALLRKMESVEAQPTNKLNLDREEVRLLRAVATFALDDCPIEGGMMRDDGTPVPKDNLRALREKLASFPGITEE